MKIMKWSSLTLAACRQLGTSFYLDNQGLCGVLQQIEQFQTGQSVKSWRENADNFQKMGWEIIENWDIRLAGKLFEIFPNIIPKKYKGQTFTCEYDDKGDWVICFG